MHTAAHHTYTFFLPRFSWRRGVRFFKREEPGLSVQTYATIMSWVNKVV